MEPPKKRQRRDAINEEERPRSLSTPISPPQKHKCFGERCLKSPWQLTWIRDLPEELNQDTITLKDILGDPLIGECWEFNYLHDVTFLMDAFDSDTRHLVDVHIVHGLWKRDDPQKQALLRDAAAYKNVKLHVAPMPEMFGTHHSKMMILFRHDDTAEIIIHTANMIPKDWTNMTNAVWRSPRLPRLRQGARPVCSYEHSKIGSGERFKTDMMTYLRWYDGRQVTCEPLAKKLSDYDFTAVRAALIASVPGRHEVNDLSCMPFGWPAAKRYLKTLECQEGNAEIVVQVSSIATLGAKDTWLQKTLFDSLVCCQNKMNLRPKFKIVFPTADEIRTSLDGYASGGSIHTRIQSAQQAQQLNYLQPIFYHWANDSKNGVVLPSDIDVQNSGRNRASPHIKTYIRYNENKSIDWALLTSANLSKQAWGETANPAGKIRIASWELGVLVWPGLLDEKASMVGTFQSDFPNANSNARSPGTGLIGLRMPYSVPLQRYSAGEMPWVASMTYTEPDCYGKRWIG